jgi:metallo-beta-lactamase family protein
MSVSLTFCGAAGTVTGSCYWITHPGGQFLLDCGLFQGSKTVKELNYRPFPFDPELIDFALLTHAHIDHSGLLPKLVKAGFKGQVFATEGTRDLLTYMLPDSGYIQETEVKRLNRRNAQRGRSSVTSIYTRADAEACLTQIRVVGYDRWIDIGDGVRARYWNAGHILGSASIELEIATGESDPKKLHLLFSGDVGPDNNPFLPDPEGPEGLDYLFCEATYGSRTRPPVTAQQRRRILGNEVKSALKRGGNLLIPSFAVERTQELLLDLCALMDRNEIPEAPVFLDSPLAIRATDVFTRHFGELEDVAEGSHPFERRNVHFTASVDESKAIARFSKGAIIMAASGMCDAGRIRHHLKSHLWRRDCTVLIVGYQAPGSLGQLLLQGKKSVRIHGEDVAVRATIAQIDVYSGHADQGALVEWVSQRLPLHRGLFLTHGEDDGRAALRDLLVEKGLARRHIHLPQLDDVVDLVGQRSPRKRLGPHRLPPKIAGRTDWHNDYAQFILDLQQALSEESDDKDRRTMLRRLRKAAKLSR